MTDDEKFERLGIKAMGHQLLEMVYDSPDGAVGGYGHLVFDDGNYDMIAGCIKDANEKIMAGSYGEETRLASLAALTFFNELPEELVEEICEEYHHNNNNWKNNATSTTNET